MPRLVHFELNVKDVKRTIKFYGNVFSWKIEKWNDPVDYWLFMTGNENKLGIDGGLGFEDEAFPKVINTIDVKNIDEIIQRIEKNGGRLFNQSME